MAVSALFTIAKTWKQPNVYYRLMNKKLGYTDNEILFSLYKEGNPMIYNKMNEPGGH